MAQLDLYDQLRSRRMDAKQLEDAWASFASASPVKALHATVDKVKRCLLPYHPAWAKELLATCSMLNMSPYRELLEDDLVDR